VSAFMTFIHDKPQMSTLLSTTLFSMIKNGAR